MHRSFPRLVTRLHQRRLVIMGSGTTRLPLTYVGDMAEAALLAGTKAVALSQTSNLAADEAVTQRQYFTMVADMLGPPWRCDPFSSQSLLERGGMATN